VALVAAALIGWPGVALADPPKPLTEAQLLSLVQIKIPDDVIVKRVADGGVDFPAGDEILARLRAAGASESVLEAVRKAAKPAAEGVMSVWVARNYNSWENPLHSELSINGKSLGTFTSESDKPLADHLKPGWNTITLKTAPQPNATKSNELIFRVGPVARKDGKRVMTTVLWEFRNGTDWKHHDDGAYTHQLGPAVKEVTLNYQVYYAGMELEGRKLVERDYAVIGTPEYSSWNSPVTGTVFVNGQPVSTFLGQERQVVITPYLRKGENTIRLVSARVKDAIADNDVKFRVGGPAEYNVTQGKFELRPIAQFEAMEGWKRDPKTGQLVGLAKADADTVEREIRFTLDEEPGK
jgi:hypothetical protein